MKPRALFPEVVVNGRTIPQADIAAEAQNHSAPEGKPGIAWRKAANALAIRELLLQEAARQGIEPDPQNLGQDRFETKEEALIRGLLDQSVDAPQPEEGEVRQEWEKAPERFTSPPLWEVSHILCACDPRDEAAREKARTRALHLTKMVLAKPTGFAALAAQESDCGSKSSRGALGQLGPGDTVPEFEEVLEGLSEGEITPEPVLTRHGWHIIRMDGLAPPQVLPYEAVKPRIAEAIERAAWVRAAHEFIGSLAEGGEITGVDLGSMPGAEQSARAS